MHNRDMLWITNDHRKLKLRDLTSAHLDNISKQVNNNLNTFEFKFGKERTKNLKNNITQEIRLRKLNRIKIDNDNEDKLF